MPVKDFQEYNEQFNNFFYDLKKELFCFELLDSYEIDREDEDFVQFQKGNVVIPGWLEDELKDSDDLHAKGVKEIRLHITSLPLSEYLRWEIATLYRPFIDHGVDVFLLSRNEFVNYAPNLAYDFAVFDDETVFITHYDEQGRWTGYEGPITEQPLVKSMVSVKNYLLSKAVPLEEFLKSHDIEI